MSVPWFALVSTTIAVATALGSTLLLRQRLELHKAVLSSLSLFTASFAIFGDPRRRERDEPRAANIDGRWYHFFQRRDIVRELQTRGLL